MKQQGFNLIELMVTLVIIGILASVAVPAYRDNVIRASRGDGMTALQSIMNAQENFFINELTYTTDLTQLNLTAAQVSPSGKYIITASACGARPLTECVRLTATGQNAQAADGILTHDSQGVNTHNGNAGWPK
ncbi:type IV pilin protein [Pseudomonas sp. HK3]